MSGQREKVIFLHLHKTGGLSVNAVLHRQFIGQRGAVIHKNVPESTRELIAMQQAERDRLAYISGHVYYGIHQIWSAPASYFTFLREPIDRTVSSFNFLRVIKHGTDHRVLRADLEAFLREPRRTTYLISRLAGYRDGQLDTLYAESGMGDDELLAIAETHLRTMRVVGLTEQFDTSLLLLRREFGWQNIYYVRRNTTSNKGKVVTPSPQTLDAVRPLYAHDTALYKLAVSLFDEQCRAYGPSLAADLAQFRKNNALYGRVFGATERLRDTRLYSMIRRMMAGLTRGGPFS